MVAQILEILEILEIAVFWGDTFSEVLEIFEIALFWVGGPPALGLPWAPPSLGLLTPRTLGLP